MLTTGIIVMRMVISQSPTEICLISSISLFSMGVYALVLNTVIKCTKFNVFQTDRFKMLAIVNRIVCDAYIFRTACQAQSAEVFGFDFVLD